MYYVRKAADRGHANFGWLNSFHSFSFGQYYDPKHMGFSALRVINDDTVSGGMGFGAHGHENMEIISYVTQGKIEHKDSLGNHFTIPAGDVQRMSAGSGIMHSEFNGSDHEALKFLQIWIQPNARNVTPSYEQATIEQNGAITPLVTPNGEGNSLRLHADASMARIQLDAGEHLELRRNHEDGSPRCKYLHVLVGEIELDGDTYGPGDGIGIYGGNGITITAKQGIQALWFDLPSSN